MDIPGEVRELGHLADALAADTAERRMGASISRLFLFAATVTASLLVVGAGASAARAQTLPASPGDAVGRVTDEAASARALVDRATSSARAASGGTTTTAGSVTETATSVASPIVARAQEFAGAAAPTLPKRVSVGVEAKIAGNRLEARLEGDPEGTSAEVAATSAILQARARLDATAPSVTASVEVGDVRAGLDLPPPPPSETRALTVVTGGLVLGRPTVGVPTEEMLVSPRPPRGGAGSLVHAHGGFVAAFEAGGGTGISKDGDRSRAPPLSPPGTIAGFGSGPRLHDLSEQVVAVGVLALIALTLTGRLTPGRSTPRPGLPQPVVVPG